MKKTTTCIVGLEHDGHVYLGGDSAGVDPSSLSIHSRIDEKVFRNDEFVMGFTSSFRMGQILRYGFVPPEHSTKKDDMSYLVTDFVDAVRQTFRERGFNPKDEDDDSDVGGQFLVGYRSHLYIIESDFQVARVFDGYAGIGCGGDLAMGSLYTTTDYEDPLQRLHIALEAATHHSAGVRPPYNFVSTAQDDYIQYPKP